jgi:hypothetical protein
MSSKTTKTKGFCRFGEPVRFSKSQLNAQIFIYIIAIILFSLILLYGYNAIRGFKERSEQISYIRFKTDLSSAVKRISPDYGTLKREEFFIGGEYTKVCFVQSYKREENKPNILATIAKKEDWIVEDSIKSGVDKNVFLFTDTLQESFDVGEIDVTDGYLCINLIKGKAKIQFKGKGDHTYISSWG